MRVSCCKRKAGFASVRLLESLNTYNEIVVQQNRQTKSIVSKNCITRIWFKGLNTKNQRKNTWSHHKKKKKTQDFNLKFGSIWCDFTVHPKVQFYQISHPVLLFQHWVTKNHKFHFSSHLVLAKLFFFFWKMVKFFWVEGFRVFLLIIEKMTYQSPWLLLPGLNGP